MARVEFRLSMPGHGAAVSTSFGVGRAYVLVRSLSRAGVADLLGDQSERSWRYRWDDGWVAQVTARAMRPGERAPRSDGFAGYDWMVDSILRTGEIRP